MNCPNCGAELPDDSKFCGSCGKSLDSSRPGPGGPPPPPPPPGPPPPGPPPGAPPSQPPAQGGYYDQGPGQGQVERTSPLAIISLICGLISLPLICCCYTNYPTGLAAIITGAIALSQISKDDLLKGRGLAIAGIICGIAGIVLGIGLLVVALLMPESSMNYRQFNFR